MEAEGPGSLRRRRLVTRALLLSLSAAAIAAASGCGDDDATGSGEAADSGGLDRAKASVVEGEKPNEGFEAPGPAFDASELRGKSIWVITFLSVPFAQQNVQGLEEAAEEVGAEVTPFDGTAGVDAYQRGIRQAIARGADAIVLGTLDPALFTTDLKAAQARGIKVVAVSSHAGGVPPEDEPVDGYVDPCYECAGQLMANSVIADSEGKAEAVVLWSSDVRIPGQTQLKAIESEFERNCPDCKLDVEDVPVPQWATRLQSVTQTILTSRPNVDYLLPLYDGMVSFMVPAVRAANALSRVKIASFNATPAVMEQIETDDLVLANVGIGSVRYGWGWADQTFRALAEEEPVADEKLPVRLFDDTNIGELDLDASTDTWYGDVDYRSEYRELWGLGG
jgi:ribose transport system substrate-binding protein